VFSWDSASKAQLCLIVSTYSADPARKSECEHGGPMSFPTLVPSSSSRRQDHLSTSKESHESSGRVVRHLGIPDMSPASDMNG
jgi:hypothetical protein